jgi:hypothetical protein
MITFQGELPQNFGDPFAQGHPLALDQFGAELLFELNDVGSVGPHPVVEEISPIHPNPTGSRQV